ncbi:MAG TPA: putative lipid II flippase FtsW [Candidatus Methylomirabilis sp.]|nr:putative lipid II flippase FtsW [Candidatus Methylomirabilis sp.]
MRLLQTKPGDPLLTGLVIGLSLFGLAMLLSASGPVSFQQYSDPLHFVRRQVLLGLLPGAVMYAVLSRFDYRILRNLAFPALIASGVLLILVFIPGLGLKLGGSHSWIKIGPFSVQPSEFVKVTFLVYAAAWLSSRGDKEARTLEGGLAFLGALGAVILLLVLQPDTGSMAVIALTSLLMYFTSGAPLIWFAALGAMGATGLFLLIKLTPYRAARFMTFLHPELDPQGIGYHINQAFLAIGSGGVFGLGYGQSRQKYLYLPEVQGDSIFAVIGEEMGFAITVSFLVAVGVLVWRCFVIARQAHDRFGMYLAIGVGAWIGVQTFVNVASMVGLMPITGVTLPFVSYGNSATVSLFVALGIVASVCRTSGGGRELV